jgi:hypothetical protein
MKRLATILLLATNAWGAVPSVLTFTGTLSEGDEAAVDGEYAFEFRVFDAPEGGTQMWVEPLELTTRDGVFNAVLGAGAVPLGEAAFESGMAWLEIEAAGDVLSPRLQVTSVPYALLAGAADRAASLECTGCIGADEVDSSAIQRRVSGSCGGGESVVAVNVDGSVVCAAAVGLAGSGMATTAARSDHDHDGDYLPAGVALSCPGTDKVVAIDPLSGNVACAPDVQAIYTGGAGIVVVGTTISTSFAGFSCMPEQRLSGFDAAGDPTCAIDATASVTQQPRANVASTADATGSSGRGASVTIGADGLPVISHHDAAGGDLRVVKCGDPACAVRASVTVDGAAGATGEHSSIAIGADGLPVVSYYDVANGDLRVAKCGDAACSGGYALHTLDGAAADVGRFT